METGSKYADSVNVDVEMEDIFDKPMVEVDISGSELDSNAEQPADGQQDPNAGGQI